MPDINQTEVKIPPLALISILCAPTQHSYRDQTSLELWCMCANTKLQPGRKRQKTAPCCLWCTSWTIRFYALTCRAKAFEMILPDSCNTIWGTPRRDNLDSLKLLSGSTGPSPLDEKDPLKLFVCVDSCRDNCMSAKGRATMVEDERCKGATESWQHRLFALTVLCLSDKASTQHSSGLCVWPLFLQTSSAFCSGLALENCLLE